MRRFSGASTTSTIAIVTVASLASQSGPHRGGRMPETARSGIRSSTPTTPIPTRYGSAPTTTWCRRVSPPSPGCRSFTRAISSTGISSITRCRDWSRRTCSAEPQHGAGVWAPAIRHHDGRYWIYYPDPDFGIYLTTATDPRGVWSKPVLVKKGKGLIDPCPLWDDDGRVYLMHAFARSRAGFANVLHLNRLIAGRDAPSSTRAASSSTAIS